jgi:hypothetical protein
VKVDLKGVDAKTLEKVSEPDYFTREKKADREKKGEEAFFKHGEKPEVGSRICSFWWDYRLHSDMRMLFNRRRKLQAHVQLTRRR